MEKQYINTMLSDAAYLPFIIGCIDDCVESIDVLMYLMSFNPKKVSNPVSLIVRHLVAAKGRGVCVRIALCATAKARLVTGYNRKTKRAMALLGIEAGLLEKDTVLHNKFVLLDGQMLILGSHNLSEESLLFSHNTSVALQYPGVCSLSRSYFDSIWRGCKR